MIKKISILLFFIALALQSIAQTIIPKPCSQILANNGELLIQTLQTIYIEDSSLYNEALMAQEYFKNLNLNIRVINTEALPNMEHCIYLKKIQEGNTPNGYYELTVFKNHVYIQGNNEGVFYGIISLVQLSNNTKHSIATQAIVDYPRYTWRGMHLDVCRHFFPVSFVKKYIDLLALHKLNTFHWHLTDDQGWRIEIKKYPLLTTIASKRKETMVEKNFNPYIGDGIPYEGYYTQEEIKEVVAYAQKKHVTIVPEIEMPGHAVAALSAYPQYSCNKKPLEALTIWGVSDDVFCVQDSTFQFIYNILDEVIDLFPSKNIHIGGDEVPKTRWKTCKNCQQVIKTNNLKDEHALQSYFIKKIDAYVTKKGRNIIGWVEILEGGLAPNAAVMSWRGEEGGIAAAKQKHNVVMCPGSYCYFDHYQANKKTEPLAIGGFTTVEKTYSYEPTPSSLTTEEQKYILGAQGNVWTEYITITKHVEYMALPRMCAISEVLWSKKSDRNYKDFTKRLVHHFTLLNTLNYNYATSIFDVEVKTTSQKNGLIVSLTNSFDENKIMYSVKNNHVDTEYKNPLLINKNTTLVAANYNSEGKQISKTYEQSYVYNKATAKKISTAPEPSTSYNKGGAATLTNGIVGTLPWSGNEWLGWSGKNVGLVLNLEKPTTINTITIAFLQDEPSWIYLPTAIELYTSIDGKRYKKSSSVTQKEIMEAYTHNTPMFKCKKQQATFIKLKITSASTIATGKPGAGEDAWLFISEILVD